MEFPRKWSSNFFEYLKYFMLLSFAIIGLISGVQFFFSYRSVKETAIESGENTLMLLKSAHETVMSQIEKSTDGVFSNSLFQNYMIYYEKDNYTVLINAQEQLDSIVASNEYINSICIYYRKYDFTLSSDLSVAPLSYYHDSDFIRSLNTADFKYTMTVTRNVTYAFAKEPTTVVTLVRTLPVHYSTEYSPAYVLVDIDIGYIENALNELNTREHAYILVADRNGNVLAGTGNSRFFCDEYMNFPVNETLAHKTPVVDGEKILVLYTMSVNNGWMYIYTEPLADITGAPNRLWKIFLAVCAVALLISTVMSLLLSYRIFKPISSMYEKFIQAFGSEEDGCRRETDRIIRHIDEIVARNVQIESQRQADLVTGRNRQFIRLLQVHSDMPDTHGILENLGLVGEDGMGFVLMAADVGHACENDFIDQLAEGLARDAPGIDSLFAVAIGQDETTVLFRVTRHARDGNLNRAARVLQRLLGEEPACSLGISAVFGDGADLSRAYRQAREALDMRMVRKRGSIIRFDELSRSLFLPYPMAIENSIFIAMRNDNDRDMEHAVTSFEEYLVSNDADANTVRSFYLQLYCSSQKFIFDLNEAGDRRVSRSHLDLLAMPAIEDMNDFLLSIYRETLGSTHSHEREIRTYKIDNVCRYIDVNLDGDLSIRRLGEQMNINPTTLRKIFKEEMGITIKQYIDKRRIETAKKLLVDTDIMIKDLAERLGFWHSQSFIAFFKSTVGLTPGEYKLLYQNR